MNVDLTRERIERQQDVRQAVRQLNDAIRAAEALGLVVNVGRTDEGHCGAQVVVRHGQRNKELLERTNRDTA